MFCGGTWCLPIQPGVLAFAQAFCAAAFCAGVGKSPRNSRRPCQPPACALPHPSKSPTLLVMKATPRAACNWVPPNCSGQAQEISS
eukprot:76042-Amphidinium_carterae.3